MKNQTIDPMSKEEAISAMQAQAVIEADRKARVQHTLAELKKLLDADQTDITVKMMLLPGQYPTVEIVVVARP